MKISVVIPVYNAERYLTQCVESVINQSFKEFEVILINDGSTDNSGKICEGFADQYSQISVYHKENGGVSSARNLGLAKAIGEWIAFLDSDDAFLPDRLENLWNFSNENEYDLIFDNMSSLLLGGGDMVTPFWPKWDKLDKDLSLTEMLRSSTGLSSKSYSLLKPFVRKSFLDDNHMIYNETLKQSEDIEFYFRLLLNGALAGKLYKVGYLYNEPQGTSGNHASQSNTRHRVFATELVKDYGWKKMSLSQRFWLYIRLENWRIRCKWEEVASSERGNIKLKRINYIISNPWYYYKYFIQFYVRNFHN